MNEFKQWVNSGTAHFFKRTSRDLDGSQGLFFQQAPDDTGLER
jgi:hypothetical protein